MILNKYLFISTFYTFFPNLGASLFHVIVKETTFLPFWLCFFLDTVAIHMDEHEEREDLGQKISFKIKKCGGKHMYYFHWYFIANSHM